MGTCFDPRVSCDTCFEVLIGDCLDDINLSLGLTPSTTFFFRLLDKWGAEYDFSQATDGSGDFTLDQSQLPDGLINQYAGEFWLETYSDSGRTVLVSIVQDFTAYACVLLTQELSGSNNLVTPGAYVNKFSTELDGVDEYVKVNGLQSALVGTTQGAWTVRTKFTDLVSTNNHVPLSISGEFSNSGIFLQIAPKTGSEIVQAICRINGVTQWLLRPTVAVVGGDWIHWGITHNGTTPILYRNGIAPVQSVVSGVDATAWISAGDGIFDVGRIGALNFVSAGNTNLMKGFIDELRVWNVNKSAAEILADHNAGVAIEPDPVGLVSSYKMGDSDIFPTIKDHEEGNTGTMVNMSTASFVNDVSP